MTPEGHEPYVVLPSGEPILFAVADHVLLLNRRGHTVSMVDELVITPPWRSELLETCLDQLAPLLESEKTVH